MLSRPDYVSIGDPYKPANKELRASKKDGHLQAGHDVAFKPAKIVKDQASFVSSYGHMNDRVEVKKNYRDEDGEVILEPRNFTTKPLKKGEVGLGTSFGGHLPHMPDTYDEAKIKARKELELHWKKIETVQEGKRFFQRVSSIGVFNRPEAVYGEDVPLKHRPTTVKKTNQAEHERAFRPSMPTRSG